MPVPALVVGRRTCLEAVRAGRALELLVAEGARSTPGLRELTAAARAAAVPIRRVAGEDVDALAGGTAHQGVAAAVRVPEELGEADLDRQWSEGSIVLVLDGVTDPRNVGALARTAEAAGAEMLVVRGRRGSGWSAGALRSSAGALLHLPVASVANLSRALERLKRAGFWVAGLDGRAERALGESRPPPGPLALVVGAEGEGLSRLVRESCDELLRIPMRGRTASLNVSVAAGVALFGYAHGGNDPTRT